MQHFDIVQITNRQTVALFDIDRTESIQVIVTNPQTWAEIDGALTDPFAIPITSLL